MVFLGSNCYQCMGQVWDLPCYNEKKDQTAAAGSILHSKVTNVPTFSWLLLQEGDVVPEDKEGHVGGWRVRSQQAKASLFSHTGTGKLKVPANSL